jgi:alpha-tubulin suppressor-like RCC1 family protein
LGTVSAISCGSDHNAALLVDGTVRCWGKNSSGQSYVPFWVKDTVQVAAGGNTTYALKSDGTVISWGDHSFGQRDIPDGIGPLAQLVAGASFAAARMEPMRAAADLNRDGVVDGADLGWLLGAWGPAAPDQAADLNHDGMVDGADLGTLLGSWSF